MAEPRDRQALYRSFIEFIQQDSQRERRQVNRRMLSVFLWCFLIPVLLFAATLVLIKAQVIPARARSYLDWMILAFPVAYSIYFLSFEVLREIPAAFRRGGLANALRLAESEGKWRDQVLVDLRRQVVASREEWDWIVRSFSIDLEAMQFRTKYLTALAGAVFFLVMQGIDSIGDPEPKVAMIKHPLYGWMEVSAGGNTGQYVGLGLFLVLLYLSGIQSYNALRRYLNCAELIRVESSSTSRS